MTYGEWIETAHGFDEATGYNHNGDVIGLYEGDKHLTWEILEIIPDGNTARIIFDI